MNNINNVNTTHGHHGCDGARLAHADSHMLDHPAHLTAHLTPTLTDTLTDTLSATNPSTLPASWADPGTLSALEADQGLLYRADVYYSGSESGGDSSCSPGYDLTAAPCMDWTTLKDLTNTLTMKQEDTCVYNSSCARPSSLGSGNVFGNVNEPQEEPGVGVAARVMVGPPAEGCYTDTTPPHYPDTTPPHYTDTTPPHYTDTTPPHPAHSPAHSPPYPDSAQDDDYSVASDGESIPPGATCSKISGLRPDRRLRRREQNRQAARRCRQRKKEQSQELVKEYYQLLSANTEMQSKLKLLETEKQRLQDIYEAHLATCTVHRTSASCK